MRREKVVETVTVMEKQNATTKQKQGKRDRCRSGKDRGGSVESASSKRRQGSRITEVRSGLLACLLTCLLAYLLALSCC